MDEHDAKEALRWAQGKLSTIDAIAEWAALGMQVSVGVRHGKFGGHVIEWGLDWLCVQTETKRVFIPARAIEYAQASVQGGPLGKFTGQTWMGCLRALNNNSRPLDLVVISGQQLKGLIGVVADDHIRLIQDTQDDGALGPIVPVWAITCLWHSIL